MDIKTAIETAKKIKRCRHQGGYYCSLKGCVDCENDFDAKEEIEMLEAFIELREKQNRNTINITLEFDEEEIKRYLTEADIVEVVRCKDCRWLEDDYCQCNRKYVTEEDYCSDGEAK